MNCVSLAWAFGRLVGTRVRDLRTGRNITARKVERSRMLWGFRLVWDYNIENDRGPI